MNKIQLQEMLDKSNISKNIYCLEGGLPSEQYCLEENYGKWGVYYSERGNRSNYKIFFSETEACEYLFNWIMKESGPRLGKCSLD